MKSNGQQNVRCILLHRKARIHFPPKRPQAEPCDWQMHFAEFENLQNLKSLFFLVEIDERYVCPNQQPFDSKTTEGPLIVRLQTNTKLAPSRRPIPLQQPQKDGYLQVRAVVELLDSPIQQIVALHQQQPVFRAMVSSRDPLQ